MALTPSDYYVTQAEIDAKIDLLIPSIDTDITTLATYLEENVTSKYISIVSTERENYNALKPKVIKNFIKYCSYGGLTKTLQLKTDIIQDRGNDLKTAYILEDTSIVNVDRDNNLLV